jgi:hypothetical protein
VFYQKIDNVFLNFIIKEKFEDNAEAIRIRKSKKNRQHNGQSKKDKLTSNDLQIIHLKLKLEQHEAH